MATYTNPNKAGESIVSNLTTAQAIEILRPIITKEGVSDRTKSFASSLVAAASVGNLRGAQTFYFYKLAEDNNPNKPRRVDNSVDMGAGMLRIHQMFKSATDAGLKKPRIKLKYDGKKIVLSLAPPTGTNKDHVYVKWDGEYMGKVSPAGKFSPVSACTPGVTDFLRNLSADPAKVAGDYGRETGNCCFCSIDLTDARSVSVGYGPICAGKYGLPWG